jgi:hypothetical protein
MTATLIWITVLVNSVGSYAIKLAGQSLPSWILEVPRISRMALLLPIAMLSALVAVLTFSGDTGVSFGAGTALLIDARLAGLAFAVIALLLRAPFLVVVIGAAAVASLLRLAVG